MFLATSKVEQQAGFWASISQGITSEEAAQNIAIWQEEFALNSAHYSCFAYKLKRIIVIQ